MTAIPSASQPEDYPSAPADSGFFQPSGTAWALDRPDAGQLLSSSRYRELRTIYYGSNACYLALLEHSTEGRSLAIYKPAQGEYPLWDFPHGSLYRREVATFRLDSLLGWNLVPPTVVSHGRFGVGSLQLFVEEALSDSVRVDDLRRLVLLDWAINNADRKPSHVLVGHEGKLWAIDHGLTFHAQPKLRTVLWHFAGEPIPGQDVADLRRVAIELRGRRGRSLRQLLSDDEHTALIQRIDRLVSAGVFPNPRHKAIPYRW